ncbi:MAG: hypothetical protein CMJ75_12000 [Planctomycetaceae bacterium]|nr:hypothetical protein [Planctomycetaceae bacterium]
MPTDSPEIRGSGSPAPAQEAAVARDVSKGFWSKRGLIAVAVVVLMAAAAFALIPKYFGSKTIATHAFHRVSRGDLTVAIIEEGALESSKNTEIKCEIRGGYGGKGGSSGGGWGRITVNWVIPNGTMVKAGEELVRLDTKEIDETVSLGKTDTNLAKAELSKAKVALDNAEIAVKSYLEGQYRSQLQDLEDQLAIAAANLKAAEKTHAESESLFYGGSINKLALEAMALTVIQAKLDLKVAQTNLDVFKRITKVIEEERLNGEVIATKARVQGRTAGLELEQGRLDLALQEQKDCLIKAKRDGLVIYPSAAGWKRTPDITEGATVRQDQVLLLMPDLTQMRITIGIHESIVERVREGLPVRVELPDQTVNSVISSVAAVARPAGWWTGNVVKYDAVIELPEMEGLKPGMSAKVEVKIAQHTEVLMVPGGAVVETDDGYWCWVDTATGLQRRAVELGDSNLRENAEEMIVVKAGLKEGDQVVLDPTVSVEEAQVLIAAEKTYKITRRDLPVSIVEQGTLESSNNTEIKNQVRGKSTITWLIENGTMVQPGDELVRLDNKALDEQVAERNKYFYLSKDAAVGSAVRAKTAELAIPEYLEGRYIAELKAMEKRRAFAESHLRTRQNFRDYGLQMEKRGYESKLRVAELEFDVEKAHLAVDGILTEIDVFSRFTKREEVARLEGEFNQATAQAQKDEEVLFLDDLWLKRIRKELSRCVVKADRSGLVIYPTTEDWKDAPDVTEGGVVHKNQLLLLMPDLSKMQVKVGIHESVVDLVQPGMRAQVNLPGKLLDGQVSWVAPVASPAGWWTGNVVKYDVLIELPATEGLNPGMSAEVEIKLAEHPNVLTIPVAAVVETQQGYCCWVKTASGTQRRTLELGDGNNVSLIVESGLAEGDEVILNPAVSIAEARAEELKLQSEMQKVLSPFDPGAETADAVGANAP